MKDKKSYLSGRVELNISKGSKDREYVVIKPDKNQSLESLEIAKRWINNNFLVDSPYKMGIVSIPREEWKEKEGKSKTFVDGLKRSAYHITWTDKSEKKDIMNGIPAITDLLAGGAPAGFNIPDNPTSMSQLDNLAAGGGGGGGTPPSLPSSSSQPPQSSSIPGSSAQTSSSQSSSGNTPPVTPPAGETNPPTQQNASFTLNMKGMIQLWERVKNDI